MVDLDRIYIDRDQPLPDPTHYLHPPCFNAEDNPVYFGSATLGDATYPCKVTRKTDNTLVCAVPHRLLACVHRGPFAILPFSDAMHLVPTSHGRIPAGCRPVVGGADEHGRPLYHAVAWVRGERVPGRTSEHLGAAAVLVDGREYYVYDAHEILCWRDDGDDDLDARLLEAVEDLPERIAPDIGMDQALVLFVNSGEPRPGDVDPSGISRRVALSDVSTVTPYSACTDLDGTTPLYFGSATLHGAVLPGKVVQMRTCEVLEDDAVVECDMGFSVLPFHSADMELVPTSRGAIPQGRRPVEGNYDRQGRRLYHAMLHVVGRQFPGMCAEHLGGAQGVLQGMKYTLETGYAILCWKDHMDADAVAVPPARADRHIPYSDDLGGQWLRVPLNGNEALTTTATQWLGEQPPHPWRAQQLRSWYFASALHDGCVIPCRATLAEQPCKFACDDTTVMTCTGPYAVLPFLHDRMQLVWAHLGRVPAGVVPVEGGRDKEGRVLYHALGGVADGPLPIMGMAAEHLGGAIIVCEGGIHRLTGGYELLCWKT